MVWFCFGVKLFNLNINNINIIKNTINKNPDFIMIKNLIYIYIYIDLFHKIYFVIFNYIIKNCFQLILFVLYTLILVSNFFILVFFIYVKNS